MIHGVTEHVPEGVAVLPARRRLDGDRVRELRLGDIPQESPPLRFHFVPPRAHVRERCQVLALRDRGSRLAEPAVQPQLLSLHDVTQRYVAPALAVLLS